MQYFSLLIATFVAALGLYILEISFVNTFVNDVCNAANIPDGECHWYRNFRWLFAVIGLVLTIPLCVRSRLPLKSPAYAASDHLHFGLQCCCIFFAYAYWNALNSEGTNPRLSKSFFFPATRAIS